MTGSDPYGLDPDNDGLACEISTPRPVEAAPSLPTSVPAPAPTLSATAAPTTSTLVPDASTALAFGTATVVSVTDGDTIRVLVGDLEVPLRLIGINSPEGGECMAVEATARLGELVLGATVRLEVDVSDRDQYDRLLRYVYVGDVFVNEILVREGLAIAGRYDPDTAKANVLDAAQSIAKANAVHLWAPNACGIAATGNIRVGNLHYDAAGNDNNNLNDEWIELDNRSAAPVDLTGWVVKDESASHRYTFPTGFTIGTETSVRLHTGCGTNTAAALYWCNTDSAVWNNGGDTVFVMDPNGNIVDTKQY